VGVVLSKIPDFHGQFQKKILVSGMSRSISKIFVPKQHPTPLPTPMSIATYLSFLVTCMVPSLSRIIKYPKYTEQKQKMIAKMILSFNVDLKTNKHKDWKGTVGESNSK
jgi:hypothetical protein